MTPDSSRLGNKKHTKFTLKNTVIKLISPSLRRRRDETPLFRDVNWCPHPTKLNYLQKLSSVLRSCSVPKFSVGVILELSFRTGDADETVEFCRVGVGDAN